MELCKGTAKACTFATFTETVFTVIVKPRNFMPSNSVA